MGCKKTEDGFEYEDRLEKSLSEGLCNILIDLLTCEPLEKPRGETRWFSLDWAQVSTPRCRQLGCRWCDGEWNPC